jgi:hypothetical protein
MQKLILLSIVAMTLVLPAVAARAERPALALRRTVWWMVAGVAVYAALVTVVYPRLVG